MTKPRKYYGLVVYDDGQFNYEFGSYDKSDMTFERQYYNDNGYRLKDLQIITFNHCPTQGEIDQFVSSLNSVNVGAAIERIKRGAIF